MEETDKEYYSRRGNEERRRSRTAATSKTQSIHGELALVPVLSRYPCLMRQIKLIGLSR